MKDSEIATILIGAGIAIWVAMVMVPFAVSDETHNKYNFGLKYFSSTFIIPLLLLMFAMLVIYKVIN